MKRFLLSSLLVLFFFCLTDCSPVFLGTGERISFEGRNYICTFYDDFNGQTIDSKRWERCPEWRRQEGQWSNQCSYVEDGNLVIEARQFGSSLMSGAVRTRGKFSQKRGLYKIRFKVTRKTEGLWYAFWLMGPGQANVGNGAVDGGEIDIFELVPNDTGKPEGRRNYINSAVHWDGYGDSHRAFASQKLINDSFYNTWHEITFVWTSEYYKAYLDDETEPYWTTEGQASSYGGIVDAENYIKLTAEFGSWGGDVSKAHENLPSRMLVDYVIVYQEE